MRTLKIMGSLAYYVLQGACVVACAGDPPMFGVGVALAAFIIGLGATFTIAALGPIFNFLWVLNPFEDLRP